MRRLGPTQCYVADLASRWYTARIRNVCGMAHVRHSAATAMGVSTKLLHRLFLVKPWA